MNPKKKLRRYRFSVSIHALDLAICRFTHSFGYNPFSTPPNTFSHSWTSISSWILSFHSQILTFLPQYFPKRHYFVSPSFPPWNPFISPGEEFLSVPKPKEEFLSGPKTKKEFLSVPKSEEEFLSVPKNKGVIPLCSKTKGGIPLCSKNQRSSSSLFQNQRRNSSLFQN